jgi:hypothetical protein
MALTVKQPWAWGMFHSDPLKDVENRDRFYNWKGWTAIHTSQSAEKAEYEAFRDLCNSKGIISLAPPRSLLVTGSIVGVVRITHVVKRHASPWFVGEYGYVLADPIPLEEPIPAKGQLRIWGLPPELRKPLLDQVGPQMWEVQQRVDADKKRAAAAALFR